MPKPEKPHSDYPLFPHASGQWAKKIAGRLHYFGVWDDPQAALEKYRQDFNGNRQDHRPLDCTSVADLLNSFRNTKLEAMKQGGVSPRTFREYELVCDTIAETINKRRPVESVNNKDFARLKTSLGIGVDGKRLSPVSHKRFLGIARMVFKYANEELEPPLSRLIRYKKALSLPTAKDLRKARNEVGERLFSAEEIRALLEIAKPQMKAMIYLGINCGFGNYDCATLPVGQVDLAKGIHTYWRPKTQIARRCSLWPETAAALYAVIQNRKDGPVFVTKYGNPWIGKGNACPISYEFRKLARKLKIWRKGVTTFYSLRRTFETIGATTGEQVAVDFIMGHAPDSNDMAAVYRQRTFDGQLHKVTDHVRDWLHGSIAIR